MWQVYVTWNMKVFHVDLFEAYPDEGSSRGAIPFTMNFGKLSRCCSEDQ